MFDRKAASADAARIGLFVCRYGRMEVDAVETEGSTLWFVSAEDLCVLKLIFGRDKDAVDLERLVAVRADLDLGYVRSWLTRIVPIGDRRLALLDDLERRFR